MTVPALQQGPGGFMPRSPRPCFLWEALCRIGRLFLVGMDRHTYRNADLVHAFGSRIRKRLKPGTRVRLFESAAWISSGNGSVNLDFAEMIADWLIRGARVELKLLRPVNNTVGDLRNAIRDAVAQRGFARDAKSSLLAIHAVHSLEIRFADGAAIAHEGTSHFCLVTDAGGSAWAWVEGLHQDSLRIDAPNPYAAIAEFIPNKRIRDPRFGVYNIVWEGLK